MLQPVLLRRKPARSSLLVLVLILSVVAVILGLKVISLNDKLEANAAVKSIKSANAKKSDDSSKQPEKLPVLQKHVPVDTTSQTSIDDKDKVSNVSPKSTDCLTPECVTAAADMIYNMDKSIDPCHNFYDFTCGGWVQKTPLPDDKAVVRKVGDVFDKVNANIKGILEEAPGTNEIVPVVNAKNFYKSCVDVETIDSRGVRPLMKWLKEKISPWPILNPNDTSTDLDLTDIAIKLAKYDMSPLFAMAPRPDDKDSNKNVIQMDQPELELHQSYYKKPRNNKHIMAHENFIKRIATGLGMDPDIGNAEVTAMVDFEILIAENSVPDEKRRDYKAMYNPTTLGQFDSAYSSNNFDFKKYTQSVMGSDDVGVTDITDDEFVNNISPQFFKNFKKIVNSASKRTVANFMIWIAVNKMIDALPKMFRDIKREYNKDLKGVYPKDERKKDCASGVDKYMGFAVAKSFVDNYVEPGTKDEATEMIAGLQSAFTELLEDVNWMDETTKGLAREKNEAIKAHIAYPDFLKNSTKIEEMYKNYSFEPNELFENNLKVKMIRSSESYRELRRPVNTNAWLVSPQKVNAGYSATANLIILTSGILQPPLFSTKYPKYLVYSRVGSIIGHEITHGFDDRGRQFDKDGNVKQWWETSVIEQFNKQKKCIVDQYSSYKMDEANVTVNGILTQGENIADNGGLKQAYRAYKNWVKLHGAESTLPGLNYTVDQLFFISFGQVYCIKATPEMTRHLILNDNHSPMKYRVVGPTRNLDEFAKAFNCPRSTYMNPDEKCKVW